ncbi:hypothetical protein MGG_15656 [Pyricularia oryzae 70-15]|uniref:Uncharacterized protein n=1 Tax=Pyricularia oryzae (strain 70-15 / ATCC MYA-4617 / FGSC 8958) TaxID=242507 RepID=G4MXM7_PYRO7|nr:uncharacterized protein MGG_15656 [Pyricularia oryzae 70-15]EHA54358.1 hypothetical protein MGG_15656 [Pyricularia oryzae 70-15]KAI7920438.1 hypothetical protein M9X92_005863 [Pyricularia oryzae]KAI7924805.1 hypothetical protein M0657_004428 [Pyricularia oryzae]
MGLGPGVGATGIGPVSSPQLCFETGARHTPWQAFKLCRYAQYHQAVKKNSTVPSASQKYASQKRIRPNRHNIKPQELVTLHSISTLSQLGLRGHPYVDAKLQIPRPPARRNTFFPWRMCALCLSRLIEPAKHAVNDNGALQPCRLPLPAYHYQPDWGSSRLSLFFSFISARCTYIVIQSLRLHGIETHNGCQH